MNLGLGSVSVAKYVPADNSPAAVGVLLPGLFTGSAMAVAMAMALLGAGGTVAPSTTPHELSFPKNLMPQLTVVSVMATTWLMAAVIWSHLEVPAQAAPRHIMPEAS